VLLVLTMLVRSPKILKRSKAVARVRRHRERKKNGDVILHLTQNRVHVEYMLEKKGLLQPGTEHSLAELQRLFDAVIRDWLEGVAGT
jgi:hypothetical protein